MASYLTLYRNIPAERGDVLLATVMKADAPIEWMRKNANTIAKKRTASNKYLPPFVAMQVSDQPPQGMESAA